MPWVMSAAVCAASPTYAQEPPPVPPSSTPPTPPPDALPSTRAKADVVVVGRARATEDLADEKASSTVTQKDLDRRMPRSAPDALRYEPGVFVQQSGHGQGSAFLRGLTGQQTLMLFDGIRMNNSVYRHGPNQYFFTLDARTIRSIEVERGGGSTRWGSDALGGVIDAHPLEPELLEHVSQSSADSDAKTQSWRVEPRIFLRGTTADSERGGRLQLDTSWRMSDGVTVGLLGGFGGRDVGLLRGPPVLNPDRSTDAGPLPWVPRYQEYDPTVPWAKQKDKLRTQLGTGFDERTGDARFVVRTSDRNTFTASAYLYHESNAPRTDQCAPPTAPFDQCLTYEKQYRDLAYFAWDTRVGPAADTLRTTVSWQRQHEQRRLDLTSANKVGRGIDTVNTYGVTSRAETARLVLSPALALTVDYGVDTYLDRLSSRSEHEYTDTHDRVQESRGQYLDGSTYLYGGSYGDLALDLGDRWTLRGGARLSWAAAHAKADPQSGTLPVDRHWVPLVGHTGVEFKAAAPVRLFLNYDNSFRAPNLDDMTSRQQTGPGFQFENAALEPERAHTFEFGTRLRTPYLIADGWLFETYLDEAIIKVPKTVAECPPNTPNCNGAWSRMQLQNSPSYSELRGAEGAAKGFLPLRLTLRATISYVWSEGPRVGQIGYGGFGKVLGERVPLSRTPPLNGTGELAWTHPCGLEASTAVQWARAQRRLAISDYSDGRIPKYGTPGFAVMHVRGTYRLDDTFAVSAAVENIFNSPYRFHGSSVNGAERGLMVQLEGAHAF